MAIIMQALEKQYLEEIEELKQKVKNIKNLRRDFERQKLKEQRIKEKENG